MKQTEERVSDYWVVSQVDAQDEDKLWEEERSGSIVDYTRLVALHGSQTEEEDDGKEEEAQGHSHCAPGQDFDWQDFSILTQTSWLETRLFSHSYADSFSPLASNLNLNIAAAIIIWHHKLTLVY